MIHKIALVHGMGQHAKKWSEKIQKQINDNYSDLKADYMPAFDELFEFVEIRYDDIFDDQRTRWEKQATEVIDQLQAGGISSDILQEIMGASQKLGVDNFFMTHILDVALYKWYPMIAEEVRLTVTQQFQECAKSLNWSIISHSLGTAITHDTLQAMFTHTLNSEPLPRRFRPSNTWMIANVSRLISNNKVYQSIVIPSLLQKDGVCETYSSVRHQFDPIPMVKPFHSENAEATDWRERAGGLYTHLPVHGSNTTQLNVHAFDHYLASPSVFVPLMKSLSGRNSVDIQKLEKFTNDYLNTTAEGKAQKVQLIYKKIDPINMSTLKDFFKALKEFYVFLSEAKSFD